MPIRLGHSSAMRATVSAVTQGIVVISAGATGSGVDLPTGAAVPGAFYIISNQVAATMRVYAVGATINGATGTTAYQITTTGNKTAIAVCTTSGAWTIGGNT